MLKTNAFSMKHSLIFFMFYYKEYSNFLMTLHINEKTRFYSYKHFGTLKSIVLSLESISINYNISPIMYDHLNLFKTNLFFFSYLMNKIRFTHFNKNYDSYFLLLNKTDILKHSIFYFLSLSYFHKEFKHSVFLELNKKNNNLYNSIRLNLNKLSSMNTHSSFYEIKGNNSLIGICPQTNTGNYYFNKLLLSHSFLNI